MHRFISELRRRNVLRVAAFYAAAGWLLVQVATQVFPFFDIPNWMVRLVVVAAVLGFPVALAFSWFYELTPQGLKLESEVQADASITRSTGRRLDRWIIAVLALAVVLLLADKLVLHRAEPAVASDDKSIAVLPFENLSDDKANGYFADGIQDEILTRLSKAGQLKVISRTSTQQYAAHPGNLMEIAHQLGVANILEGSVQKIGDAVHVNVQLIRAATDEHLWAESYNRKLDDVFGVEGEVAQTVAEALKAQLSGAEHKAMMMRPTDNQAAYAAYARGRSLDLGSYDYESMRQSVADYQEAVRLDPRFALAWAAIAETGSMLYFNGIDSAHITPDLIRHAADTALSLKPELGEAWLAQGYYRYRVLRDYDAAVQAFEAAQQRLPNDARVLIALVVIKRRQGHWDEAVALAQRGLELDPRNIYLLVATANELYGYLRRFDDARQLLDRALSVSPDNASAVAGRIDVELLDGKLDAAQAWAARLPPHYAARDMATQFVMQLYLSRRDYAGAIALAQSLLPAPDQAVPQDDSLMVLMMLGWAQAWSGHPADAQASFRRLVRTIKPTPETVVPVDEVQQPGLLALAYAGLGDKNAALQAADHAVEVYRNDPIDRANVGAMQAAVQAQVGETDAALAALPRLLQAPAGLTVAQLKLDPFWDPLRGNARFQKLIAEGK